MTPSDGVLLLLVLALPFEALLIVAWVTERLRGKPDDTSRGTRRG